MRITDYNRRHELRAMRRREKHAAARKAKMRGASSAAQLLDKLKKRWHNLPATAALALLIEEFKFGNGYVEFANTMRHTTIKDIVKDVEGTTTLARDVGPINFWGGPPLRDAKLYRGTLLTFVVERMLQDWAVFGNTKWTEDAHAN